MNETREEKKALMGRATALEIIARMAYRRDLSPDDVTALQMGARAILKRHFEHERNRKRHREALAAPPEAGAAPSAIAGEPPAPPVEPEETVAERVRAVAARMRELDKKAREEKIQMGCFALSTWLEGFATRLDQAVGDDPTPWTPYEGELEIVRLPEAAPSPSGRGAAVRPAAGEPPTPPVAAEA